MKKLLGILVLGLLWCNVGFANILTLSNCYSADSRSKIGLEKKFDPNKYEISQYSINFDTGTVIRYSKQTKQEYQRRLEKNDGKKYPRSNEARYKIEHYDNINVYASHVRYANTDITINIQDATVLVELFNGDWMQHNCVAEETIAGNQDFIPSGTAFFISKKGHLLTNNHVVDIKNVNLKK